MPQASICKQLRMNSRSATLRETRTVVRAFVKHLAAPENRFTVSYIVWARLETLRALSSAHMAACVALSAADSEAASKPSEEGEVVHPKLLQRASVPDTFESKLHFVMRLYRIFLDGCLREMRWDRVQDNSILPMNRKVLAALIIDEFKDVTPLG